MSQLPALGPRGVGWVLIQGILFVLIAASAGFMYWALIHKLESEDDQFMAEKVQLVRLFLRGRATEGPVVLNRDGDRGEPGRPPAAFWLRVLGPDGRVLAVTDGMDAALPVTLFPPTNDAGSIQAQAR